MTLKKLNKSPTSVKKQSQYNEVSFYSLIESQNMESQRCCLENQWYYFKNSKNDNFYLFHIR